MIELVQVPYSPFCIVQRRILEFAGTKFKLINIPNPDRSLVWKLTRRRYYEVPVLKDGRNVIFETGPDSQVIGKYLDSKLGMGLFPADMEGVQSILWRYIEGEIEGRGFKLNDVYSEENVPRGEHLGFIRHKERKFGRGCLALWREQQEQLLAELTELLLPFEEMVAHRPFLIDQRPRFVDFDLFGMLENFLYSGHYSLPSRHAQLIGWHRRMGSFTIKSFQ
ncbi:MAG: glutathione S-transferase family protein [Pedosphaera sp.]|nr:glutathione S-transferase family protein [Pedosphaera sp.]